jgi:hypothetical protein
MIENEKNKSTPVTEETNVETVVEKVEEVVEDKVIVIPPLPRNVPTLGYGEDGVMGSTNTNVENTKVKEVKVVENLENNKVALFSTRSMYADGLGKLNIGYNIVSKRKAELWMTHYGVRLATPEEVAEAFA